MSKKKATGEDGSAPRPVTPLSALTTLPAMSSQALRALWDLTLEGVLLHDAAGVITACNARALALLGLSEDDLVGRSWTDARWTLRREDGTPCPADEHPMARALAQRTAQTRAVVGVARVSAGNHDADGNTPNDDATIWLSLAAQPILRGEAIDGALTVFTDITVQRRALGAGADAKDVDDTLAAHGSLDPVTGAANAPALRSALATALRRATKSHGKVGLLLVDLDGFADVNARHGRPGGDAALVEVARRLRACVRRSDLVARRGDDEFAIVLERVSEEQDALTIARKVAAALDAPMVIPGGAELIVHASIGVACSPSCGDDGDALTRSAAAAMADVKGGASARLRFNVVDGAKKG